MEKNAKILGLISELNNGIGYKILKYQFYLYSSNSTSANKTEKVPFTILSRRIEHLKNKVNKISAKSENGKLQNIAGKTNKQTNKFKHILTVTTMACFIK